MAPETQPSTTESSQNLEAWSNTDLENALAHLERLQNRLDHLRSAIPDLVKPLQANPKHRSNYSISTGTPRTKADVMFGVREVAVQRAEEVRVLGEVLGSGETARIFERARESERAAGELGRCVEVPRWGWVGRVEGREREEGIEVGK